MTPEFAFSWSQFLWMALVFVGVPTLIGAGVIRSVRRTDGAGTGKLGLWATGLAAFPLGFASCLGWLTWSADYEGESRGPGLPAPTQFPAWQVLACGATVVLVCLVSARLSRWAAAGGLAAAAGTAAGFTTAFAVDASSDTTGQAGVGVLLTELGVGVGLGVLMFARGLWLTRRDDDGAAAARS